LTCDRRLRVLEHLGDRLFLVPDGDDDGEDRLFNPPGVGGLRRFPELKIG
jgi:hypothetical protein